MLLEKFAFLNRIIRENDSYLFINISFKNIRPSTLAHVFFKYFVPFWIDERINVFCLSCQKPTCSMCKVFGSHQTCEVVPIKKAYDDQKGELREHISRLK